MRRWKNSNATKALLTLVCLMLLGGSAYAQSSAASGSSASSGFVFRRDAFAAHAQQPTPQDDPLLKGCEAVADELKLRRAQVESLSIQIDNYQAQIALYRQLSEQQAEQVTLLKSALADRTKASGLGSDIDKLRVEQLAIITADRDRLLAENARLRSPSFFKTLFNPQALTMGIVGFGIGRATGR